MLIPKCKLAAAEFLRNERTFIESTLSQLDRSNSIIVVGCANLAYYELITQNGYSYVGVDPHVDTNEPRITRQTIESFLKHRNRNKNYTLLFWFNVIAHININEIENNLVSGDILINSTWSRSYTSLKNFSDYYSSVIENNQTNIDVSAIFDRNRSLGDIGPRIHKQFKRITEPNLFEIATVS